MHNKPTYQAFQPSDPTQIDALAALWNSACPDDLHISSRFVRYNIGAITGGTQAGRCAVVNGEIVGAVLASALPDHSLVNPQATGWIDLIAVQPAQQRQGIGRALISWAERWLTDRKCRRIQVGGSQRPFVPGVPTALESDAFFDRLGYGNAQRVWDVAADLATYQPPATVREVPGAVRPAQPGDEAALHAFLAREFPGRWYFDFQEYCRMADYRLTDFMLLWTERGVDGFCRLTFEDSPRPIERYYPYTLPRPWGQLGPIGVSADCRGQGFGAAVLDAGLRRLHNNGVNGCVIDWT
ncbi:MAG: GNAT family N-acetyltransferase, partial [Caldilineaceae bacterium]|nr:GNAT family N-acetyltransferase [Caldilineaceae bacterium]